MKLCILISSLHLVAALYDPLNTSKPEYPDFLVIREDFDAVVSTLRAQDSRYQHLYDYKLSSLQWSHDAGIESSTSHCLHFGQQGGDTMLQNLRVAYLQELVPTIDVDELSKVSRDHDHFRVTIPNVGVYDNLEAAAEYTHISIGSSNDGFVTEIKNEIVEETPYFASRDTMAATSAQLRDWNNGAFVGTNLVTFELQFRPCSVALDGMTITFDDASIETFREQQFSNRYLCERIMEFCIEDNLQYDSITDCMDFLDSLPDTDDACQAPGHSALREVTYSLEGNTSSCRFLHHFMAAPDFRPDLHCPHLGKNGGPDPNQQFKCSSAACEAKQDKANTIEVVEQLPACRPEWKEQAELALLAALPTCLEAVGGGACTPECRQAMVQFALAGYKQSADYANDNQDLPLRTRSCICSEDIRNSARSSVLSALEISPANLLASCGVMAPSEERTTTFDACEELAIPTSQLWVPDIDWSRSDDFMKEIVDEVISRSLDSIETSSETSPEEAQLESESLIMDLEYVKAYAGDNFYRLIPDSRRRHGCPFFHGPAVFSYDQVLGVLNKAQNRVRTNGLFNIDHPTDKGIPHEAVGMYNTGTPEHLGLRASFFEAFPSMSKQVRGNNAIEFQVLPDEILGQSLSDLLSVSDVEALFNLQSLMRFALEPLFPDGSEEFLDTLSSMFVEWLAVTEDLTVHSSTWHSVAGEGRLRIYSLYLQRTSKLMRSYFGPDRMHHFASLTRFTKTSEEISRAWAAQLYNGLGFAFITLGNVFKQIGTDPCKQAQVFKENPEAYILEVLRIGNHSLAGNAVIGSGESSSIQYNGEEISYSGGVEWKAGQPYAVLYSLTAANKDEAVFPQPAKFDPSRHNLNMTLSFGAPEATFSTNRELSPLFTTNAGMRGCVAHNYVLAMLASVAQQLLDKETFCYERRYQESYTASAVVMWALAGVLLLVQLLIWVFLCMIAKPSLASLSRDIKAIDDFEEESSYLSQSLREDEDFAQRKLSLRSLCLAKASHTVGQKFVAEKIILEGISLDLVAGRLTALMGESGSGKSSLLNTIARFNDTGLVASGSIIESCDEGKRSQGGVSYVHHDYKMMLFEDLTAFENLVIGALVRVKQHSDGVVQAIKVLVDGMKLHRCLDTPVKNMSSGEKRRLSIAVECLRPSRIMLLDEPLAGLDSTVALETVQFLKTICTKYHKIMLLIIHQPSMEVYAELDDLIVMKAGRCVFSGPRINASEELGVQERRSLANPSDVLMEHVARNSARYLAPIKEDPTHSIDLSLTDSDEASGSSSYTNTTFDPSEIGTSELTPFNHRFLACILVSWLSLRRDRTLPLVLFGAIPLAIFFLALYNIGPTQPHEAIAMMIMLIAGPSCLMVQTTASAKIAKLLSLVNMKRFGLYSGIEYTLHLVLFYGALSSLMVIIVYSTSLLVGLVEIMTWQRFWELLAVALALQLSVVALDLLLNLCVSRPGLSEHQFYTANNHMCCALMVYLAVGLVLSGLLYRTGTAGVPYLYDIISFLSPPFWGGLAMLVSLLDGAIFPGCSSTDDALLCLGDTYLLNYGLDERPYIPGFSIWFLLLVIICSVLTSFIFGSGSRQKPLPFVSPLAIVLPAPQEKEG